jgi:hypothetical protein
MTDNHVKTQLTLADWLYDPLTYVMLMHIYKQLHSFIYVRTLLSPKQKLNSRSCRTAWLNIPAKVDEDADFVLFVKPIEIFNVKRALDVDCVGRPCDDDDGIGACESVESVLVHEWLRPPRQTVAEGAEALLQRGSQRIIFILVSAMAMNITAATPMAIGVGMGRQATLPLSASASGSASSSSRPRKCAELR